MHISKAKMMSYTERNLASLTLFFSKLFDFVALFSHVHLLAFHRSHVLLDI